MRLAPILLAWVALALVRPGPASELPRADARLIVATVATAAASGLVAAGLVAAVWWPVGWLGRRTYSWKRQ